ncbi:MAG: ATP-binding protein, partial [Peristeroidobacter soli]
NLNDVEPLIANSPHATRVRIPLPDAAALEDALLILRKENPRAFPEDTNVHELAQALSGVSISSLQNLVRIRDHGRNPLGASDLTKLKKQLVEQDSAGLVEFIEGKRTLADYHGQEALKTWLRQDIALWRSGDLKALPMGYLLCGPVGTGKTFLVECLAGEAGVPVVKLKNFRDRWVGSSEGNLEKIFRLIRALGRCMVFIDEADQTLGKRDSGSGDSGLSGRIYSMIAQEMSDSGNRGRVLWLLASSRPDLIEVDLKRPGRVDVKVPLLPTSTTAESAQLIALLAKRYGLDLAPADLQRLEPRMPVLLTPGAAEALVVKAYRHSKTAGVPGGAALEASLEGYQNPVPADVLDFQMRIAIREATDLNFVPPAFRVMATEP